MSHSTDAPRFHTDEANRVPRMMVRAVLALILSTLALVTWSVMTRQPLESLPPISPLKAQRAFSLDSDLTGAVRVFDATGALLADLPPEKGGFIAGVHRVILHERGKARLPEDGPVLLQAYENGRMAIIDPATGWRADLMGFGADNARAFARLLAQPRTASPGQTPDAAPSAQP